jgi:acetyltransferase-like isoleucine patch superfamily enzyme
MKKLLQEQWAKIRHEKGWSNGHPLLPGYVLWRIVVLAGRWLRASITFRGAQSKGKLIFQNGQLHLQQAGELCLGNRVRFWSTIAPTHLRVGQHGKLTIEDDCYINGALISADISVKIGRGVYLAPMSQVADSYAFGTPEASQQTAPIVLEENVWIATRAIVLPGVTVGKGAVVGVGSIVSSDVPAGAIVAGVPARVIRYLQPQESPMVVKETVTTPDKNPEYEA